MKSSSHKISIIHSHVRVRPTTLDSTPGAQIVALLTLLSNVSYYPPDRWLDLRIIDLSDASALATNLYEHIVSAAPRAIDWLLYPEVTRDT
jgi:hypothetical protein